MTAIINNTSISYLPPEILGLISEVCQDPKNALAKTNKQLYNTKDIWSYRCSDIYSKWLHTTTNTHPIVDEINQNHYQKKLILHIDTKLLNFERFKEFIKIRKQFEMDLRIDEKGYDKLLRLVLKTKDCSEFIQNIKTIHFDQTTQANLVDQIINCNSLHFIQQSFPAAENFGFSGRIFTDTVQRIQQSDFSRLNELKIQTIDEPNFLALIAQALQIKKLTINYLILQRNNIQNIPVLTELEYLHLGFNTNVAVQQAARNIVFFNDVVVLLEKTPRIKSLTLLSNVFNEPNPQNQMLVNNVGLPFLKNIHTISSSLDSHYLSLLLSKSPDLESLVVKVLSTEGSAFTFGPCPSVKKIHLLSLRSMYANSLSQFLHKFPKLEVLDLRMDNPFIITDFAHAPPLPHLKTICIDEISSYPRIRWIFRKFTKSYRALHGKYPHAEILQSFRQRPIQYTENIAKIVSIFTMIVTGAMYVIALILLTIKFSINSSNTNSAMMLLNRVRQMRFAR